MTLTFVPRADVDVDVDVEGDGDGDGDGDDDFDALADNWRRRETSSQLLMAFRL